MKSRPISCAACVALFFGIVSTSQGVTQPEAPTSLREKAEQGDAEAQYYLGKYYIFNSQKINGGAGVGPSYWPKGLKWYREAAEQGHARAQTQLGYHYELGNIVEKDMVEALRWYHKAADQGDVTAQERLSYIYIGDGLPEIPRDEDKSVKWLRKAADLGNATTQYDLGGLYQRGFRNLPQDLVESYVWYSVASSMGNKKAFAARNKVANQLSPEQLAKAKEKAAQRLKEIQERMAKQ